MFLPVNCPNPHCQNHDGVPSDWLRPHGAYVTKAFGMVPRYKCIACGRTVSAQTASPHKFSKQPLPFQSVARAVESRSLQEAAKLFGVSTAVIRNHLDRLERFNVLSESTI